VEGIFFYWFMWLAWIVSTFLMKKEKMRLKLSIFILFTILISQFYVELGQFYVRVSLLLFLLLGYYLAVKQKRSKSVLFYLTTFTLTFAYTGIMLFRIYDPVWFVFDYRLIISIIVSVLAIYLGKLTIQRYSLYIISVCQGEFIYWFILGKFHDNLIIGTFAFLDMLVIGCLIIYLWTISQNIIVNIEQSIQKTAKEKQG
jgi:hydrogenase maturation factor